MCRRAVLVLRKGERPHPRRAYGRAVHLENAADDSTISEDVAIVVMPLARMGATTSRRA